MNTQQTPPSGGENPAGKPKLSTGMTILVAICASITFIGLLSYISKIEKETTEQMRIADKEFEQARKDMGDAEKQMNETLEKVKEIQDKGAEDEKKLQEELKKIQAQ